jgi:hypothetical protein
MYNQQTEAVQQIYMQYILYKYIKYLKCLLDNLHVVQTRLRILSRRRCGRFMFGRFGDGRLWRLSIAKVLGIAKLSLERLDAFTINVLKTHFPSLHEK